MKQKIVIKVSMNGTKWRTKSLKIAVGVPGVESAALGGQDKTQIEVTGDGVDAVELTRLLRKKVGYAELVSVAGDKKEEKNDDPKIQSQSLVSYGVPGYVYEIKDPYYYQYYNNPCSIL